MTTTKSFTHHTNRLRDWESAKKIHFFFFYIFSLHFARATPKRNIRHIFPGFPTSLPHVFALNWCVRPPWCPRPPYSLIFLVFSMKFSSTFEQTLFWELQNTMNEEKKMYTKQKDPKIVDESVSRVTFSFPF